MLPHWLTNLIPARLPATDLQQWREATLAATSRLMAVLAIPVVILSLLHLSTTQAYWRMPISLGFGVLIGVVAFWTVASFRARLFLFFGTLYLFASLFLISDGLSGVGRGMFLLTVVLAAILLQPRAILLILLLTLSTQATIYAGWLSGWLPQTSPSTTSTTTLIGVVTLLMSQAYVYLFVIFIITLAMHTLQHYLYQFHTLQAAHTIQISEARYRTIWETATDAVVLLDSSATLQEANPAFFQTYGYTPAQVQGKPIYQLLGTEQRERMQATYKQLFISPHPQLRLEFELLHADGTPRTVEAHLDFLEQDGKRTTLLAVIRDMTARKQIETELQTINRRLHELANRDGLTNVFNRRYLDETLPREIMRATRHNTGVGIILIDLDHFKQVNDTHGHAGGDSVLRIVAEFLQAQVRGEDLVYRYGGEEFVLMLPGANRSATLQRAQQIHTALAQLPIQISPGVSTSVTGSIGVATFPDHGNTTDELLLAADHALYAAKHGGRNRIVVADDPQTASAAPPC